jgi:hypothetical protein
MSALPCTTAAAAAIGRLPARPLAPGTPVADAFLWRGIPDFREACRWVEALPYAHNETDDPLILFADGYGTCFTKHAVVARLAAEIGVPVQKYLGFYRLTDDMVTGVGEVLGRHRLPFIPQMHCFIGYASLIVDLTAGNATGRNHPIEDYDFIVRLPGEPTARDLQRLYGVHLARYAAVEPRLASLTIADASRILAECDAIAWSRCRAVPISPC